MVLSKFFSSWIARKWPKLKTVLNLEWTSHKEQLQWMQWQLWGSRRVDMVERWRSRNRSARCCGAPTPAWRGPWWSATSPWRRRPSRSVGRAPRRTPRACRGHTPASRRWPRASRSSRPRWVKVALSVSLWYRWVPVNPNKPYRYRTPSLLYLKFKRTCLVFLFRTS